MAEAVVKAVMSKVHASGLPRDEDKITFVFESVDYANAAALAADLEAKNVVNHFFTDGTGLTHPLGWYMSNVNSHTGTPHRVDYFDITTHLNGSAAGPPILTGNFGLSASGDTDHDLPAECAAVITMYGEGRAAAPVLGPVSSIPNTAKEIRDGAPATHDGKTHPKQSHTGRVYVGPLNSASGDFISVEWRISDVFREDLAGAMGLMSSRVLAMDHVAHLVVWSRKLASVDTVIGGHVDNAFDTQRRRGVDATARTHYSF